MKHFLSTKNEQHKILYIDGITLYFQEHSAMVGISWKDSPPIMRDDMKWVKFNTIFGHWFVEQLFEKVIWNTDET